jgi:hypothetical protein
VYCCVGFSLLKRMTVFDNYFSVCAFFVDALIPISILLVFKMTGIIQKTALTQSRVP